MRKQASERKRLIIFALEDSGGMNGAEIARAFALSPRYARRIVGEMFNEGLIDQTHAHPDNQSPNQTGGKPSLYVATEHGRNFANAQNTPTP